MAQAILQQAGANQAGKSPVRQALLHLEDRGNRRALRLFGAMHYFFPPGRGRATDRQVRTFLLKRVERLDEKAGTSQKAHAAIAECLARAACLHHLKVAAYVCHQKAASRFRAAQMHARAGEQELLAGRKLQESRLGNYAMERYGQALKDFDAAGSREGMERASAAMADLRKAPDAPGTSPNAWPQVIIDHNSPPIVVRDIK